MYYKKLENKTPENKTLEEHLKGFKRSGRKSFHGYCGDPRGYSLEAKFWEWMASTSTKYDENGRAITTRPSKSGLIHRLLMKSPGPINQKIIVLLLMSMIIVGIVGGLL